MFLVDSFEIGGSELAAFRTARAIRDRVALTVVHLQQRGPLRARYEALGLRLVHAPLAGFRSRQAARSLLAIRHLLREEGAEVLHAHDYYANIVAAATTLARPGTALIVSRRWMDQYIRPVHARLDYWASRRSSMVLTNSEQLRLFVLQSVRLPPHRVAALHNFVADSEFLPPVFAAGAGPVVFGMVGRLAPVKNHRLALEALAAARGVNPGLRLVICGDGHLRSELVQRIEALGLREAVELRGVVPDGPDVHRRFDVGLLTSLSEGSPNAVLECLAAGRPVIATDVGGVRELVRDGETGFVVPSGDVQAVARSMLTLANPTLREAMGEAAFKHASSNFRESHFVARLLGIYASVARPSAA